MWWLQSIELEIGAGIHDVAFDLEAGQGIQCLAHLIRLDSHGGLAAYVPSVVRFFQNEGILGVLKADSLDLSGVERGEDVAAPIFSEGLFG